MLSTKKLEYKAIEKDLYEEYIKGRRKKLN